MPPMRRSATSMPGRSTARTSPSGGTRKPSEAEGIRWRGRIPSKKPLCFRTVGSDFPLYGPPGDYAACQRVCDLLGDYERNVTSRYNLTRNAALLDSYGV